MELRGFVDALLQAPLGVAVLARLEARCRSGASPRGHLGSLGPAQPDSIRAAVESIEEMALGDLLVEVLTAGRWDVGPWNPGAGAVLAEAYRDAEARRPIAEAITSRFGPALHSTAARDAQQWWTADDRQLESIAPLFADFDHVYGAGQFTWAGLWTVTDPPAALHHELVDAWELHGRPVGRWLLPVSQGARVFEIHRPRDWLELVSNHPRRAASQNEGWELPGVNQERTDLAALLEAPGQRAVRTRVRHHLVPDWRSVAEAFDGVHVSWAGLITAEGFVSDLDGGDVAMLRYWCSERTHWLKDVLGDPQPLEAPALPRGESLSTFERREHGAQLLRSLRGR